MKIGFVILCYGQHDLIIKCVNYLNKLDHVSDAEIVLVDNCSPDNTGEQLEKDFSNIHNITVIRNIENEGFAKGNNIGYAYARQYLNCDCLIVMNSDVFIEDEYFLIKLQDLVEREKNISIVAPDVLGNRGRHCNPLAPGVIPNKLIIKNIIFNILANILFSLRIDYRRIKRKKRKKIVTQKELYNIMPHGCCVIYCPAWIKKEKQAFYPNTFLFCEEYFLTTYAQKKGYVIAYKPELVVRHLGDASIENTVSSSLKKQMFINKCQNQSLLKYLKYEKDIEKNWTIYRK